MKAFKNKELWYVVGLIAILAISTVFFFFPDLIDNKYPYSYQNVRDKNDRVVSLNSSLSSTESEISQMIEELNMLKDESKDSEIEALKIKEGIDDSEFELDIPSLLIALEQNARLNKIGLDILYDQISHVEAEPLGSDYPEDEDMYEEGMYEDIEDIEDMENADDIESEESEEEVEDSDEVIVEEDSNEGENEESDEETDEDEDRFDLSEEDVIANAIKIPGIDVTVIPIKISGSYSGVRSYIKYLDKVGMIEPSSAVLSSTGDEINGLIMLNVFHGEVGL